MLQETGDIWTYHAEGRWIIITTNIGWKKDGCNPMGAGTARQAADKYSELPAWYGEKCRKFRENTAVTPYRPGRLLLFPTKPLDSGQPWLSWQQNADLNLIRRSAKQLAVCVRLLRERGSFLSKIGVPLVGCQNGNLRRAAVLPILQEYLDDHFVLLERP
jgi:hypothetical protein